MKAALLPYMKQLLAFFSMLVLCTPATAQESKQVYLIIVGKLGSSMLKVPVKDLNQCEEQGAKFISSSRTSPPGYVRATVGFECLEGK